MSRLLESRKEKDRMKETSLKNKEKERLKEREKETREREARSSSGHLFTSLSVSATTLCSSCNKSITAKEALSCPGCNVTIHNRCRDSVASCAKMKQRQQKLTLVRNNSALQNVALRTKTPMMKERPSSAIYPSDTLRQSLLGSRRVRSGLTLAKSVSTNNIAGGTEDSVGLRRILSQSTESLNFRNRTLSMESLTDDGEWWWSPLLEELQKEGCCIQADSWSLAVDSKFLQTLHKDVIKQQDVIYELIQTEFHHVRTLRIMEGVYRRGMQEEVMLEAGVVHTIFPCLDQLLELHSSFLSQLLHRRKEGLVEGSSNNFTVRRLGDLLLRQFSGQCAEDMKKLYSEFCSRHPKAVKLYKEVLNRDRRLQQFIRRVCRGPLLRRHGVLECILLVTQRITKYPVLIQRILDNTKGCPEELQDLQKALVLLKELISSVDQEVLELDRNRRLQEIQARLDPRAQAEVKGGVFRGGELLRRKLLHDGTLTWKVQGSRMKEVQVLLMSDILVFLQEKDQKFTFASLDKSPVVSLTNLIVREVANQEKGMYLISDSTPPEMYELYAASKDDRKTWMSCIQQTAQRSPSRDEFPLIETEDKALLRRLRADIQQKDKEVLELLQERATLFSDLLQATARGEAGEERSVEVKTCSSTRNLFRADTPHAPKAEPLLLAAIGEVDKMAALLSGSSGQKSSVTNGNQDISNGDSGSLNGSFKLNHSSSKDRNGNQLQDRTLNEEVRQRLVGLSTQLHALQAAVIRQDSILELSVGCGPVPPAAPGSAPGPRLVRSMSRDAALDASGEAVLLRRQVELLQEELSRLRLKAEESTKKGAGSGKKKKKNKGKGDGGKDQQAPRKPEEPEPLPLAPLALEDPVDQLDGLEEGNEEEEEEVMKISPRSDSPRDLQDIPEESES
ncbi:rho guanine nucleotide exchange factor 2 [Fundulus heteroclitus]|uniref:rho guanine nucleotide exchange factor 2 n=1 Tax=Fundulus heteroclitus TaxID=8078 RepID=UPI00165CC5DF|nr:rho guanine nucleotide exchange factor 2 [Fundulus heteroclitus]XP_035991555.1 rho guanine nucleotide exchange factor 2 [Fundulus heteroclitus]XP_035991556.1 rho guanine nucleotide exchange factor 2 [Fundulus heteroclitus]